MIQAGGRFITAVLLAAALAGGACERIRAAAQDPPPRADKRTLTPAQQKIDSQILIEIQRKRGGKAARDLPPAPTLVRLDDKGRALVDIRVKVTRATLDRVKKVGGTVVSSSAEHMSIIARVPLLEIERLAEDADVRAIVPAAEAITVR